MKSVAALLFVLVLATACGQDTAPSPVPSALPPAPLPPPPTAPPPPPPSDVRGIRVGEEVKDALTSPGSPRYFELTAPSDGVLIARLSWDTADGYLEMWLADTQFVTDSSPIVGKLQVVAGGKYRVSVYDANPWDYGELNVPFVLITSLE